MKGAIRFKTYHKLQGSQTQFTSKVQNKPFKTYHKLQGSQTNYLIAMPLRQFKTYHKLQGSQTLNTSIP